MAILGQGGPNRWIPGAPLECKVLKKKRNLPSWGELRCLWCTNRPSGWPLSSPPEDRLRFYSIPYTSRGLQEFASLGHLGPKWPKSAQKGGNPCFDQFFSKIPGSQTMLSSIFETKWGISPRWTIRRGGGDFPTFSRNSATTWSGCPGSSQDRVFRGGWGV